MVERPALDENYNKLLGWKSKARSIFLNYHVSRVIFGFFTNKNNNIFHLHLAPTFDQWVFQLYFCAEWLPMIRARKPSVFNSRSLRGAANPTRGRSKHDEG